jgi:alcohol dehydrogenase (cytochrome c)
MNRHDALALTFAVLIGLGFGVAGSAVAADVTADRLSNPDKEPQNWLMNHRTYDAQRYSPLDKINKTNVKSLRLAYAVAIGGTSANENLEATPLAEDGYLYVVDQWGVVYKVDGRSGDLGRIVWRMDPMQERLLAANRGAALWGSFVISVANYPARVIATDKETGKVAWETNLGDGQPELALSAAPLPIKDKIVIGAGGGDRGVRDFIAALDGATGKVLWRRYTVPAPGEPGSETWKDNNNAWQTGGGAMWVTGSYDVATNQVLWGTGNPVPMHKLVIHSARNGFLYAFERTNGQTLWAKPYMEAINWTKGIDQKTGLPIDYDPRKDIQVYSGLQNQTMTDRTKRLCPSHEGGNNYWSASFSQRTRLLYIPSRPTCNEMTMTPDQLRSPTGSMLGGGIRLLERTESEIVVADPFTGEIRNRVRAPYPNFSAALTTAGGLLFTGLGDGTFVAYDDTSLEPLWKINVGAGINAPPMTFEAGGRQYVTVMTGLSRVSKGRITLTPELREMRDQTMLFVFGL